MGLPFGQRPDAMRHGAGLTSMGLGVGLTHALLALMAPVRGVVLFLAQLARRAAGGRRCRWGAWWMKGRCNQGQNRKVGQQLRHIATLDLRLFSVVGAGDGVLGVRRLLLDPAGEARRAKRVATRRQQAGQVGSLIEWVVADAALEEGGVDGEGRGGSLALEVLK